MAFAVGPAGHTANPQRCNLQAPGASHETACVALHLPLYQGSSTVLREIDLSNGQGVAGCL